MNTKVSVLLATLLAATAPFASAANVAAGAAVTTTGAGFFAPDTTGPWGTGSGAALSTVVDGVTVADGQQWNMGTVFWIGNDNTLDIQLTGAATVSSIFLQGDNNDAYAVSYEDLAGNWLPAGTITPNGSAYGPGSVGWGMGAGTYTFASAVDAQAFRITATGDGYYAVSEFQANGEFLPAVPEPTSALMLLAGLGALGAAARRRAAR